MYLQVKFIHKTHFGLGKGKTTSRHDRDKACHFPFEYQGRKYNTCTEKDSPDHPWCAITAKYTNTTYGYCDCPFGRCCVDYKLNIY